MSALPLSARLKTTRKRLKLSQPRMAKALGISMRAYFRYEAGERVPPKSATVLTLESLLGRLERVEQATIPQK